MKRWPGLTTLVIMIELTRTKALSRNIVMPFEVKNDSPVGQKQSRLAQLNPAVISSARRGPAHPVTSEPFHSAPLLRC